MKGQKTGGRVAGTPNKVSGAVRQMIANFVNDYYCSKQFSEDFEKLEPKERVAAIEKLTAYITPKLQQTSLDMNVESEKTIEDELKKLAGD
jgi:hypothetical protein